MDEQERKKYPSLPPDYVTIAMLRERWLQKQEERNLNEKQEQEALEETQNPENECQNEPREKLGICHRFENNSPRNEEKGKGKGMKMGCFENGGITKKKYRSRNKKSGAYREMGNGDLLKVKLKASEKRQNHRGKEGLDLDETKNGCEGVEIKLKNKVKVGIVEFLDGESGMTEVLPKNGLKEGNSEISTAQNVRSVAFRGGFGRIKNSRKELKDNDALGKNTEDDVLEIDRKGNGSKWRHKRGNSDKLKQGRAKTCGLNLNEGAVKSEDEISEIGSDRDGMKTPHSSKGRNDIKQNRVNGEALNADTVVLENKVEDTVLVAKSRNDGFKGYGHHRGNLRVKFENFTINDTKERSLGSKVEKKFSGNRRCMNSRRFEAEWKMKQRDSGMVWVKKEQSGAVAGDVDSMGVSLDQ